MSKTIEEWKDDLLAEYSAALTERDALRAEAEAVKEHSAELRGLLSEERGRTDALRAENNRLRNEVAIMAAELCRADMRDMLVKRLTRAAQANHRAWKRERDLVERYQRDHDEWMWTTDKCDCAICDEVRDRKSLRSDARDGIVTRLRAFVRHLRADGLDIDDPDTAPVWTGKIHDSSGALLFDLATARAGAYERVREALSQLLVVTGHCHPLLAGDCTCDESVNSVCEVCADRRARAEAARALSETEPDAPAPTPYSAICHHQTRPDCAGCPDDAVCEASGRSPRESAPPLCTWCGKPVETAKNMRVVSTDAAGLVRERP